MTRTFPGTPTGQCGLATIYSTLPSIPERSVSKRQGGKSTNQKGTKEDTPGNDAKGVRSSPCLKRIKAPADAIEEMTAVEENSQGVDEKVSEGGQEEQ